MSKQYVLAVDAGTSGIRAILYDYNSRDIASSYSIFTQFTPAPGLLEQDPLEIWDVTRSLIEETIKKAAVKPDEIAAIGVTGQRATVLAWNKHTGLPVHRAIVWQDLRTQERCRELTDMLGVEITTINGYTRFEWLLDHVPNCREDVQKGDVLIGTIDSWLIWKLTGGEAFVTDPSNAVTTGMWHPATGEWMPELAGLINLPVEKLATILPSSHISGTTSPEIVGATIPVAAVCGDQQAAMFGHLCVEPGEGKASFGTSVMVNVHTGGEWTFTENGYPLALWRLGDEDHFCLEGTVITGGATVNWIKDLRMLATVEESMALAKSVSDSGGVFYVPALQGLGTPYMESAAKGALLGLTRASTRAHIVRAALEGIAFRTRQVVETLRKDAPDHALETLQVDGGMAGNDLFLQMQADVLGIDVKRPSTNQVASLGIAYLAGLAVGFWSGEEEIRQTKVPGKTFSPGKHAANLQDKFHKWTDVVEAIRTLSEKELFQI